MILLEIGLNNHHIAIAQQNKSMVLGGVHSPELEFGKNYTNARSVTKTGLSHPVIAAGMGENHTIMTVKLNIPNFSKSTSHNLQRRLNLLRSVIT